MKTVTKKLYEAMFLVDSAHAAADWDGVNETIKNILERAEAEIVSQKKWADRKLAYEINHKTKGVYILCYFKADSSRIQEIERNVQLSERIVRVLILNAEKQTLKNIEQEDVAITQESSKAEAEQQTEEKPAADDQEAEEATALDNEL